MQNVQYPFLEERENHCQILTNITIRKYFKFALSFQVSALFCLCSLKLHGVAMSISRWYHSTTGIISTTRGGCSSESPEVICSDCATETKFSVINFYWERMGFIFVYCREKNKPKQQQQKKPPPPRKKTSSC